MSRMDKMTFSAIAFLVYLAAAVIFAVGYAVEWLTGGM